MNDFGNLVLFDPKSYKISIFMPKTQNLPNNHQQREISSKQFLRLIWGILKLWHFFTPNVAKFRWSRQRYKMYEIIISRAKFDKNEFLQQSWTILKIWFFLTPNVAKFRFLNQRLKIYQLIIRSVKLAYKNVLQLIWAILKIWHFLTQNLAKFRFLRQTLK